MIFELRKFDDDELKEAISYLESGGIIRIGDINIRRDSTDLIEVIGWSLYNSLKLLTKKKAEAKLFEIRDIYFSALNEYQMLSDSISHLNVKFDLVIEMYKSGILVCSMTDEKIEWHSELQN